MPAQALHVRETTCNRRWGPARLAVNQVTPAFTGNLDKDFTGAEILTYQKADDAAVRSACVRTRRISMWAGRSRTIRHG